MRKPLLSVDVQFVSHDSYQILHVSIALFNQFVDNLDLDVVDGSLFVVKILLN
jgi:hypothetical protein